MAEEAKTKENNSAETGNEGNEAVVEETNIDGNVDSIFSKFEEDSDKFEEATKEKPIELLKEGDESTDEDETDEDSSSGSEESKEDKKDKEDVPSFFKTKEEMETELSQIAQKEYEGRQIKEQTKTLEKENKAYKEIFERFQSSPLQVLKEMYGDDVVEQLQALSEDDKTGGTKQSTRAMQQRIEKLERERQADAKTREIETKQTAIQDQVSKYTGMLTELGQRDDFALARKYCEHQGLDLVTEASIYAGRTMEANKDQFVEPIDALRGIQEYVERIIEFGGKANSDTETSGERQEGINANVEDKTTTKTKKTQPSTLKNKDDQVSGVTKRDTTEIESTADRHARVDKLFDAWERTQ